MKLAAAQIKSYPQQTDENIRNHLRMIDLAAEQGVSLVLFPEMSLTGYERELASELAFDEHDTRLHVFRERAMQYQMLIIVGAPIKVASQLCIGAFAFAANGKTSLYTKQYLHAGEEHFFVPGSANNPVLEIGEERVSIAICADIVNSLHPAKAAANNTSLYVASIFYTPGGIDEGYEQLETYSKKYGMNILMANYAATSYGMESAGKSACWNKRGELLGALSDTEEALLIVTINEEHTANRIKQ